MVNGKQIKVSLSFQSSTASSIVQRKKVLLFSADFSLVRVYKTIAGQSGGPALWPKDFAEKSKGGYHAYILTKASGSECWRPLLPETRLGEVAESFCLNESVMHLLLRLEVAQENDALTAYRLPLLSDCSENSQMPSLSSPKIGMQRTFLHIDEPDEHLRTRPNSDPGSSIHAFGRTSSTCETRPSAFTEQLAAAQHQQVQVNSYIQTTLVPIYNGPCKCGFPKMIFSRTAPRGQLIVKPTLEASSSSDEVGNSQGQPMLFSQDESCSNCNSDIVQSSMMSERRSQTEPAENFSMTRYKQDFNTDTTARMSISEPVPLCMEKVKSTPLCEPSCNDLGLAPIKKGCGDVAAGGSLVDDLFVAVTHGELDTITRLLQNIDDVNQSTSMGSHILFRAVMKAARLDIVRVLLDAKADVRSVDGAGNSLMHFWARANATAAHLVAVGELLLQCGADIDAQRSVDGMTPLHYVAIGHNTRKGWVDFHKAKFLLLQRADPSVATWQGQTPLDILLKTSRAATTRYMRQLLQVGRGSVEDVCCEYPNCIWCKRT
jgi:ankyrin repeat protein